MPHASAANSVAVTPVTSVRLRPGRTRPAGTGTWPARTAASGRVRSRLSSPVTVRSAASTTAHRSPVPVRTGSTTRSARPPPSTGTDSPSSMRPPPAGRAGQPGGQRDRAGQGAVGQAGQELRKVGPGAAVPAPAARHALIRLAPTWPASAGQHRGQEPARDQGVPQLLEGDRQLAEPVALAAGLLRQVQAEQAGSGPGDCPPPDSAAARTTSGPQCRPAQPRTDAASSRCSSLTPSAMVHLAGSRARAECRGNDTKA